MALSPADAEVLERCMAVGGVALAPTDTVYSLLCEPDHKEAVRRVHALRGGRPDRPQQVLFFALDLALAALPELDDATRGAVRALLPGPVTAVLPNPAGRFGLAVGAGAGTLLLRVPTLDGALAPLRAVRWPVLQAAATTVGSPRTGRLADVSQGIREGVDLVLDAGDLPGVPTTVVDLRSWGSERSYAVLREGALEAGEVDVLLDDA